MPSTPPTDGTSTVTVAGITAAVAADPYRKGESLASGPWREIVYRVSWPDSDAFIDGLMAHTSTSGGPTGTIKRTTPHRYPGNEALFAVSAEGNPMGVPMPGTKLYAVSDGQGGPGLCDVLVRYEVPRIDFDGSQTDMTVAGQAYAWSRQKISGRTKIVHLPPGSLKFAGSGFNPSRPFDLRLHQEEIRITFFYVPTVYLAVYRGLAKFVNNAAMFGWAAGCVLFEDYDFDLEISSDGTWSMTVELLFLGQPVPWNKMPKDEDATPATGTGWDTVNGSVSGLPVYPSGDLTALLR